MRIFAMVLGPHIIGMVADNDAGGITVCAVTGSKIVYSFTWVEL
jgi:Mn2+/Fe2+ NRAMP family transporter